MSNNKRDYISTNRLYPPELPKGMWEDVKNKVLNEVNFKPSNTQVFIYVFLHFLQKTIHDYDKEKQNDKNICKI